MSKRENEIRRLLQENHQLKQQLAVARCNVEYIDRTLSNLNRKSDLIRDIIVRSKLFLSQIDGIDCLGISEAEQNQKLQARSPRSKLLNS